MFIFLFSSLLNIRTSQHTGGFNGIERLMLIRLFKTSTLEKSDTDIRAGQLACYRKPYSPTSNNNEVEITF
ncbi:hypothetical protein A0U89_01440 [Kozakia baliensis]|uniref:Uncharacterized protein n=1 Tax=Kozakia baliensis TaxID=153496 RepID=A0A1D8UQV8_9PROT|nr:hypothetical protein A0U89_01440 [Kozakia baliensis]